MKLLRWCFAIWSMFSCTAIVLIAVGQIQENPGMNLLWVICWGALVLFMIEVYMAAKMPFKSSCHRRGLLRITFPLMMLLFFLISWKVSLSLIMTVWVIQMLLVWSDSAHEIWEEELEQGKRITNRFTIKVFPLVEFSREIVESHETDPSIPKTEIKKEEHTSLSVLYLEIVTT